MHIHARLDPTLNILSKDLFVLDDGHAKGIWEKGERRKKGLDMMNDLFAGLGWA